MIYFFFASLSFILGVVGAFFIWKCGGGIGVLDVPSARSSHSEVIPKGGGIGILTAVVVTSMGLGIPLGIWGSALCLSLISFWGDRQDLSPKFRLGIQFVCCFVFIFTIPSLVETSWPFWVLIIPFAIFMAGTANFYNFMDGINGIAGITAVVGFLLLSFYGYSKGYAGNQIVLCLSIALANIGFLPFNIPGAKVFMGDIGSVLLGFLFSGFVVLWSGTITEFVVLCSFLFPFYADELITMIHRIRGGDSLSTPHRKHVYQQLVNELGHPHWIVAVLYGIMQLFVGGVSFYLQKNGAMPVIIFLSCNFVLFYLFFVVVRRLAEPGTLSR